jgi:hypothetical protein
MAFRSRPITTETRFQYHASPFVVRVKQGLVFLRVLHFFLVSRSARILRTHSLICAGGCMISDIDNDVK